MTWSRMSAIAILIPIFGSAMATPKHCPDVPVDVEPVFSVQVGTRSVRIPWRLTVSSFGTTAEKTTGQSYDEIVLMGEASRSQPFLVTIKTTATYEEEAEFGWSMLRGEGSPSAVVMCDYRGEKLISLTFDSVSTTKSIYENEDMQIIVYGDDSLEHLVALMNLLQDHW